ncbi:hypothetical protein BDM02DRAFT_3193584 [Thelephora ganbajun]|uniref:Uncharacterized protein n=1 Tax=Thelephora ganbajun TaxID=370292 RepID=A0ACB6YXV0_THEGA|nr:hypothetical protein BDM02DRAFT_3193584 [Thelephora ganbajun]
MGSKCALRSQTSPDEITLSGEVEDMEVDQPSVLQPAKSFGSKDALQALCQDRGLDDTVSKIELARQLINWRNTHQRRNGVEPPVRTSRGVLGKDVLQEVWDDMKLTELPSWMSSAPPNWGTAAWGKLTADQWMVYLNTMKTLFKDVKIQPIHHAALHAGDFLWLFGPNHSVWAFGGERYLEVLGLQNINNKSGELKAMFMTSVCRSSNLQALVDTCNLPEQAEPLLTAYRLVVNEDH